jgi:glycosyltransferase involved in cell wall biosynthesis
VSSLLLVLGTSTGGVGRHVRSVQQGLQARGWQVTVACPASTQEVFGFTDHQLLEIGSRPHPVHDLRAVARLRQWAARADVVHAHGVRAAGLVGLATARSVATWHNVPAEGRAGRALSWWAARRATVTLAVSPDLAALARSGGATDVRPALVAAPLLPPARGTDVRGELGAHGRSLVLAVGRLHPQKGLDVLLQAVPALGDVVVAIAGDGPLRQELSDRAAGLPVRLLGRRDDLADLYAAADVVVLPSRWEGRPLTAMEVLRAGRPLVASAVGGVPALVGHGARLVAPGDPKALAAAVRELLGDPEAAARLGARGQELAATWPDEDDVLDQLERVYAGLAR